MTEVVRIGDATLYHGDCLDVLEDESTGPIDFVFMDPPYGHNNNDGDLQHRWEKALGKAHARSEEELEPRPILNDGPEAHNLVRDTLQALQLRMPKEACVAVCCSGGGSSGSMSFARWSLMINDIMRFKMAVVWDKGMGMGWHYRRSYEFVLVAQVGDGKTRWYDTTRSVENVIRPGTFANKIIPQRDQHPTQKPVGLPEHFIGLHTLPEHVVWDPFMGSGTTGVAAVRAGRSFAGVELDPRWFDLACERIEAAYAQGRLFA